MAGPLWSSYNTIDDSPSFTPIYSEIIFHMPFSAMITLLVFLNFFQMSPESEMGWFKRLEFSKHFFGSVEKAIQAIESSHEKKL